MSHKPEHVERGGEGRADTPDKWSEDDTARQEHGRPSKNAGGDGRQEHLPDQAEQNQAKGHGPLKGTDTLATTDAEYIEREKGKRTTM
jgi:hypothetical protein